MRARNRGTTLVELLVVVFISGILFAFLSRILAGALRLNTLNATVTDVTQNAEIASALLQIDVKDAGFRGGTPDSFGICDACQPTPDQFANLLDTSRWPFTIDALTAAGAGLEGLSNIPGSTDDPLPTLVHVPGVGGAPDSLGFLRVLGIEDLGAGNVDVYELEYVLYTVNTANTQLVRLRQDISCDGRAASGTLSNSQCALNGANEGQLPAVSGIEELQFFFKLRNELGGQPIYTPTLPSNVSSVASVGVYIRGRAGGFDPTFTNTDVFPNNDLLPDGVLPGGAAIANWASLGVTGAGPFNDNFRRVEKVQEIAMRTTPACNLLPIGLDSGVPGIGVAGAAIDALFGADFVWLSWNPAAADVNTLVDNITFPNLVSSTYTNPLDATDNSLNSGDGVLVIPPGVQPGAGALAQYIDVPIVVPVGNAGIVSGFASIVLQSTSTINNLQATYLGPANVTCTQ